MSIEQSMRDPTGLPDLRALGAAFEELVTTIAWLRDKEKGCPWDLEQDHQSLKRYMVEEAYEAAEAMSEADDAQLRDELGDVLLQVVLNAQVARDRGAFELVDVVRAIDAKMRRRHPHVFSTEIANTASEVRGNWEKIKAAERSGSAKAGVFAGVEKKLPATSQGLAIGKLAAKINFDWDSVGEVLAQFRSEVEELTSEFRSEALDRDRIASEIGDVYFSLAQLCRHIDVDPETAAMDGNRKFLRRFARLEAIARGKGIDVKKCERDLLEQLWLEAKKEEKAES